MIATADTDADGKISWLEFLTMMNPEAAAAQAAAEEAAAAKQAAEEAAAKKTAEEAAAAAKKTADAIAAASQAFNEFDTDGSGVISASDLRNVNSHISEENISEMINVADAGAGCAVVVLPDCLAVLLPGCLAC